MRVSDAMCYFKIFKMDFKK